MLNYLTNSKLLLNKQLYNEFLYKDNSFITYYIIII